MAPGISLAQGGISYAQSAPKAPEGFLAQIKNFFASAEETTSQVRETSQDIQSQVEKSGFKEVLGKIWSALVSFFSDTSVRNLLIETAKLFLHLIANIFTLIAGALNKILEVVGS